MEWIYKITIYLFAATSIFAAISDWRYFRIPNLIPLAILVLWPVHVFARPDIAGWDYSLLAGIVTLAAGYFAFSRNWLGGGDAKFLATAVLWVPPGQILNFILIVSIAGGFLCAYLLVIRRLERNKALSVASSSQMTLEPQKSALLKQAAPYGVAIACGCLVTACQLLVNSNTVG